MYRGYKTYRHYLNAKLHALSTVICGDDTVIDEELARRGLKSVTELSPADAKLLHTQLTEVARKVSNNVNELKSIIGAGRITDRQRAAIIKIARYKFNWSQEATFSYILESLPGYRKKLSSWEIENSKLNKLYSILTAKDADKIIKRLDMIQKRNQKERSNEQATNT